MNSVVSFRLATEADLPIIINMLADDPLGALREQPADQITEDYRQAFESIRHDKNQELTVAEIDGDIVGTFHLTFIQYLTHQGGRRAQIEAVRVRSSNRGQGIGAAMFHYAINRAKAMRCFMVQLTTDKKRPDALRFYESIGFMSTHEGMKMKLL